VSSAAIALCVASQQVFVVVVVVYFVIDSVPKLFDTPSYVFQGSGGLQHGSGSPFPRGLAIDPRTACPVPHP
jgi:hypothetical protein